MSREDTIKNMIKCHADRIRTELVGARLFGQPINMEDIDSLIVAAYGAGEGWVRQLREENRQALEEITCAENLTYK